MKTRLSSSGIQSVRSHRSPVHDRGLVGRRLTDRPTDISSSYLLLFIIIINIFKTISDTGFFFSINRNQNIPIVVVVIVFFFVLFLLKFKQNKSNIIILK